jgi:TPR repeat protein
MVGLAGLYERGIGVTQDLQKAVALYQQAAATGNEGAKKALQRLGIK